MQRQRLAQDLAAMRATVRLATLCARLAGCTTRSAHEAVCGGVEAMARQAQRAVVMDEALELARRLTDAHAERVTGLVDGCLSRLVEELDQATGLVVRTGDER